MKSATENIEMLYNKIKAYTETNIKLYKLQAIDSTSEIVANIASKTVIILISSFSLLFANVALGLYLGSLLSSNALGFLIVSGFYLLLGSILFVFKSYLIENPLTNYIISQAYFKKKANHLKIITNDTETK